MTASLSGVFNLQQFDSIGALGVGMRLYTYIQGTTTHKAAYIDAAGTTPHTYTSDGAGGQYIAANARGELPAPLYLTAGSYDLLLKNSSGGTVWTRRADPTGDSFDSLAATTGAGHVGFDSSLTYPANTVGAFEKSLAENGGAAIVKTSTGATVEARLTSIDSSVTVLNTRGSATFLRRRVPSTFVRGDGNTRTDIFPVAVNYPGPGGVLLNKSPLEIAKALDNVIAHELQDDVWVSPLGTGTLSGATRANSMDWAGAWRTLTTGRKLLMIDTAGPYPPLSLLSGTHASAGTPKWLYAVDGRVRFQADTALGQPPAQTWTLHAGVVYKSVLTSVDYDQPQAVLKTLVPNVRDGQPDSILKYASVAALSALGSSGEGWYFDSATDTLYMTYYGNDLTVAGNRNFKIIYSSKTLDSLGEVSCEWLLGGCTVILEGNFDSDGVWINSKEVNNSLPILIAEGRLRQLCPTQYGIRAEGLTYTKGRQCYRPKHDGLNAYKSSMNSVIGMTIEHDLVVMGAGDIGTVGTGGSHNNQGFSAHGKHNAMVFGALFEGNDGQGWADICEAGHYSASWGVGVIVRDNYADSGISNGFYFDGSSGGGTGGRSAWLDTCVSENDTRSVVAVASAVKRYNSQLSAELTASGGTIVAYTPASP